MFSYVEYSYASVIWSEIRENFHIANISIFAVFDVVYLLCMNCDRYDIYVYMVTKMFVFILLTNLLITVVMLPGNHDNREWGSCDSQINLLLHTYDSFVCCFR